MAWHEKHQHQVQQSEQKVSELVGMPKRVLKGITPQTAERESMDSVGERFVTGTRGGSALGSG